MSLILALDTATPVCSVAVVEDGKVLSVSALSIGLSHSSHLTKLIEQVLSNTSLELSQFDAIAVSKGPGSYTGLRIGVSVAKGLCYANDLKLVAVETLDVLAKAIADFVSVDDLICPMLDARRMEVYAKVLDKSMKTVKQISPIVLDVSSFDDLLADKVIWFVGDGVDKFRAICESDNAKFVLGKLPNAAEVGVLAEAKLEVGETEDVAYFEPFYLKEFYTTAKKV